MTANGGLDLVDTRTEILSEGRPTRVANALIETLETSLLAIDPELREEQAGEPLNQNALAFLEKFIEGDLASLTTADKDLIVQNAWYARGYVAPQANSVDHRVFIADLIDGLAFREIAEKHGETRVYISNSLNLLVKLAQKRRDGKLDLETFLNLEEPKAPVKESLASEKQKSGEVAAVLERKEHILGAEAAARTSLVPEDWFINTLQTEGPMIRSPHYSRERDDELDWQAESLCGQTDPEAFFPEKGGSTRDAKKICTNCDVREQCLQYALDNDERFGIWGGLSERERRKLRKSA